MTRHGKIGILQGSASGGRSQLQWEEWAQETKESAVQFVHEGGGLVLVHAANNAFRNWDAYNEMIGLGWRPANFGDCIKWEVLKNKPYVACVDCSSGHGSRHPFQVVVRKLDHPIMKDVPSTWMHGKDELYHNMRGPPKTCPFFPPLTQIQNREEPGSTSPSLL